MTSTEAIFAILGTAITQGRTYEDVRQEFEISALAEESAVNE